jgi:hypothetical protein
MADGAGAAGWPRLTRRTPARHTPETTTTYGRRCVHRSEPSTDGHRSVRISCGARSPGARRWPVLPHEPFPLRPLGVCHQSRRRRPSPLLIGGSDADPSDARPTFSPSSGRRSPDDRTSRSRVSDSWAAHEPPADAVPGDASHARAGPAGRVPLDAGRPAARPPELSPHPVPGSAAVSSPALAVLPVQTGSGVADPAVL